MGLGFRNAGSYTHGMTSHEQVLIQDALKFLAECEYDGSAPATETLAEKLSVSPEHAQRVLADLRSAGLIESDRLALTDDGRQYALHVLRAHRLYETYLARKTGVRETSWHRRAEVEEHKLSEGDVEKLSEELGNPRFDPHGDPIPTATGEMPPKLGRPLPECPPGWVGRVTHVEDEPPKFYARIAAASIAPDTVLRVEASNDRANDRSHGRADVRVSAERGRADHGRRAGAGEAYDESVERLSSLRVGEEAVIVGLSPLCRGLERNRLLDLGVVPGSTVSVDLVNPSGSPTAYRLRGASIALRREQADRVRIRKAKQSHDR